MFEDIDKSSVQTGRNGLDLVARAGLKGVPKGALVGVAVLVVVGVGIAGWRLIRTSSDAQFTYENSTVGDHADGAAGNSPAIGDPSASGEETAPATVWVHVAGAVHAPGLYELSGGARVGDAVKAAGGVIPAGCLDAVNLARVLADGEQVYVPTAEEVAVGSISGAGVEGQASAGGESANGTSIDINTASASELVALPGVGPATADKIVTDRETNGPFTSPEDIMRVTGIGEKKFEAIRDLITVR